MLVIKTAIRLINWSRFLFLHTYKIIPPGIGLFCYKQKYNKNKKYVGGQKSYFLIESSILSEATAVSMDPWIHGYCLGYQSVYSRIIYNNNPSLE